MKPPKKTGSASPPVNADRPDRFSGRDLFALVFGLVLGLAIVKFGNPVILDEKIPPPVSLADAWSNPWPTHWANWLLVMLALPGLGLVVMGRLNWPAARVLWILPLIWFGWQIVSAMHTVDAALTGTTLWQFGGCLVVYFFGALALRDGRALRWLLVGVLAAFTFCLVRAAEQRLFEFPQDRQFLAEGARTGWSNVAPEIFLQMKRDQLIITTNGVDIANPIFLVKLTKARVYGTLVYPNALAGIILLLLPLSIVLAYHRTRQFRPLTRWTVFVLTLFLGVCGLFWTGSKSGWLIALATGGLWLFRLDWSGRMKWLTVAAVAAVGMGLFAVRFHSYFASGATSVGARFDYWRAAVQVIREHPVVGSGPGTFQRPYSRLKNPKAEMARLVHNDYLEQFSDSGMVSGVAYAAWIATLLLVLGRRVWRARDPVLFAIFAGLLGWFVQGVSEFGLYVPALAWTAFCLAGWLLAWSSNRIDSLPATR